MTPTQPATGRSLPLIVNAATLSSSFASNFDQAIAAAISTSTVNILCGGIVDVLRSGIVGDSMEANGQILSNYYFIIQSDTNGALSSAYDTTVSNPNSAFYEQPMLSNYVATSNCNGQTLVVGYCNPSSSSSSLSVGAIVGIVIGSVCGVVFIGLCVLAMCCFYCGLKLTSEPAPTAHVENVKDSAGATTAAPSEHVKFALDDRSYTSEQSSIEMGHVAAEDEKERGGMMDDTDHLEGNQSHLSNGNGAHDDDTVEV